MRLHRSLLLLGLAACAPIDAGELGQCGNNVVEPAAGEDCDLIANPALGDGLVCGPPDGTPSACRYLCSGGARCPEGWACFADGLCRYPSTTFVAEEEPRAILRVDQLEVARFSSGGAEPVARLGADLFFPQRGFQLSIAGADGALAVVGSTDESQPPLVALSALAPDGVLALHVLGHDGDRFVTRATPGTPTAAIAIAPVRTTTSGIDALVRVVRSADGVLTAVLDADGCPSDFTLSIAQDEPEPRRPVFGWSRRGGQLRAELAFAFAGSRRVLVAEVDGCTMAAAAELTAPAPIERAGVNLLDLDRDGALELVAYLEGSEVAVAHATPAGFGPFAVDTAFEAFDDLPDDQPRECDGERFVLAAGDLDGDDLPDFVTEDAIFVSAGMPGSYRRAFVRDRGDAWAEAVVGDFDGDGHADVVVSIRSRAVDCDPTELELYRGSAAGDLRGRLLGGVSGPELLRTGDFDGDGLLDLAATERAVDEGRRVSVFYGDRSAPLDDRTSAGGFDEVAELVSYVGPERALNPDRIFDLRVVSNAPGRVETALHGDAARTLVSPITIAGGSGPASLLAGPLLGGDDRFDLLVLREGGGVALAGGDLARATDPLPVDGLPAVFRPACADFAVSQDDEGAFFAIDGHLATNPAVLDRLSFPECDHLGVPSTTFAGRAVTDGGAVHLTGAARTLDGEGRVPQSALLLDLDRDGREDALVLFAYQGRTRRGLLQLLPDVSAGERAPVRLLESEDVLGIASIGADRDDDREVAVMTTSGIRILDYDDDLEQIVASPVVVPIPDFEPEDGPYALRAADMNDDGLDDLILLYGQGLFVFPAIPSP